MKVSNKKFLMVGGGVLVVLLGVLGFFLFKNYRVEAPVEQKLQEIKLEKEDVSITLNREGTLMVKIPEGTFQQQWDEEKVSWFFSQFENEDLSGFSKPSSNFDGYFLTLRTADGRETTFFVPVVGVDLPEAVEELVDALEELSDSLTTPTPTAAPTTAATPTPSLYVSPTPVPTAYPRVSPTPTPTVVSGESEQEAYKIPFECTFTSSNTQVDIISGTVCTSQ